MTKARVESTVNQFNSRYLCQLNVLLEQKESLPPLEPSKARPVHNGESKASLQRLSHQFFAEEQPIMVAVNHHLENVWPAVRP